MAARGFCPHGKVWTTCQICGKEVIAAAAKRGGAQFDEFVPAPRIKKKPAKDEDAVEAEPKEPVEDDG
jgi:hypothetical protein